MATRSALENIGAGYHTLAEAFSGWRDSPPHRANMLLKGVTSMGIAAVYDPNTKYKVFWALIVAAPPETGQESGGAAGGHALISPRRSPYGARLRAATPARKKMPHPRRR